MRIVFFAVAIMLSAALNAYPHCHNTHSHEKVKKHLVDDSPAKWNEPYNNTVEFWVNPKYLGQPNLLADAKAAAKLWSGVLYAGRTIQFKTKCRDETTAHPGGSTGYQAPENWVRDNKNVVGYK